MQFGAILMWAPDFVDASPVESEWGGPYQIHANPNNKFNELLGVPPRKINANR
jgi:hypothetical protein